MSGYLGSGLYGMGQMGAGDLSTTVYTLIMEAKYQEAIDILNVQREFFPNSRAALSLLSYSYYQMQDFGSAAQRYEELVKLYPDHQDYKFYLAQSLFKGGMLQEALRATLALDTSQDAQKIYKLQASIKYEQDDLGGARGLLEQCKSSDPDVIVLQACLLYKDDKFLEAKSAFKDAVASVGYTPTLAYNIALCHYQLMQFGDSLKVISDIIDRGMKDHPELGVGAQQEDGIDIRSVGNSRILQETGLIEAFNLKLAIEFKMKAMEAANEALSDMPPRKESELDPVTLHNMALLNMENQPTEGFRKLNFLLQQPPFPPETFGNLLLLYLKHELYDLAADLLAENAHLTFRCLEQDLYEFINALIVRRTSPEEAYSRLDKLANNYVDQLRKQTKSIQDARQSGEPDAMKDAVKQFDDILERYMPVLMAMGAIYWDLENYEAVERLFRQSAEFCTEHEMWKLNVAHTFFMQESKYREAVRYYEPLVKGDRVSLLDIPAIVLANLCVSYIMTSQNEIAEEVMRRIEREEEAALFQNPDQAFYHHCIVNLVIGTLYCAKGNFEFGISRVIKSLEPMQRRLGTDTWYYTKRCILSLCEALSKHMLELPDSLFHEVLGCLEAADSHGKDIPAFVSTSMQETAQAISTASGKAPVASKTKRTVSQEARLLKRVFLKLRE